ncbi:beta-N-acetylhexosaminidase [Paenibacillus sp. TRM 82003]|nr:beta-N-acetylhexosaminidase [Paenibacillus sp. TRM 82003]
MSVNGIEDNLLACMSLEEKIGQLLLCGFPGTTLDEEMRELIAEGRIGGVILFARNVATNEQVAALTESLQSTAADAGVLPLLVSIDQEGGMVARLTDSVALMPGNMAIGAAGSIDAAQEAARISGKELRSLGINLNYAPVLDVNNNAANPVIGVRSFGETPEQVAAFGAAAIRGYREANVASTAKHFPGHGDTSVDSHLDLPVVGHDRERLEQVELPPFRRAIAEGVDAIMTAHIHFPAFEADGLPATLSPSVLTGLLREELGFDGIIMTDCLEMEAIAKYYGTVEASVTAVEAGADIVLISHRHELQRGAIDAISAAVRRGRLSEARIDASVKRVLRLKAALGLFESDAGHAGHEGDMGHERHMGHSAVRPKPDLSAVGCTDHREAARRISEASVTLVRNEGILPLKATKTLAVTVAATVQTMVDDELSGAQSLGSALASLGLDCTDVIVEPTVPLERIGAVVEAAKDSSVAQLVIGVYNAAFHPGQVALVRALAELGKPLVVVALRNPYDIAAFPAVPAYVATYESRPMALESAAKALLGQIPFRGSLPVSLGAVYRAGWGLRA